MRATFSKPHACLTSAGSRLLLAFLLFVVAAACQQPTTPVKPPQPVVRDTTITPQNAYSELFFDSARFERGLRQRKLPDTIACSVRNFYRSRNYQYAWFNKDGFTEQAGMFWNLQSDYLRYSGDSSLYNPFLQHLMDSAQALNYRLQFSDSVRFVAEMQLTRQFVRYTRRAYQGNVALNERDLNWFIPRKRLNMFAVLDSF